MKKITFFIIFALLFVATPASAASDPVVVVPGFGASWNWGVMTDVNQPPVLDRDHWSYIFGSHEYDTLVQVLKDAIGPENVYVAFYDWRRPIDEIATNYIRPVIQEAQALSPTGKVDIVAHSMGGLVSRAYIQSDDYDDEVDQLITLGTPHYGLSDAYLPWEGGDYKMYDVKIQGAMNVYAFYSSFRHGRLYENKHYLTVNTIPSIKQLLPTYDYLKYGALVEIHNEYIPVETMHEQNTFLPWFNHEIQLRKLLQSVAVTNIAGDGLPTVHDILVTPRSSAEEARGLWPDDRPDPLPPTPDTLDGDDGVLTQSALLPTPEPEFYGDPPPLMLEAPQPNWLKRFFAWLFPPAQAQFNNPPDFGYGPPVPPPTHIKLNSCHTCLPHDAIANVVSILELPLPATLPDAVAEPDRYLAYYFASPVSIKITAPCLPAGRPNCQSITKTTNTIPGAEYSDDNTPDGPRLILIPNPQPGNYLIELTGTGNGPFHIGVQFFNQDQPDQDPVIIEGDITLNKTLQFNANFTGTATPTTLTPVPQAPTTTNMADFAALLEQLTQSHDIHDATRTIRNRTIILRKKAELTQYLKTLAQRYLKAPTRPSRFNKYWRWPQIPENTLLTQSLLSPWATQEEILDQIRKTIEVNTPSRITPQGKAKLLEFLGRVK